MINNFDSLLFSLGLLIKNWNQSEFFFGVMSQQFWLICQVVLSTNQSRESSVTTQRLMKINQTTNITNLHKMFLQQLIETENVPLIYDITTWKPFSFNKNKRRNWTEKKRFSGSAPSVLLGYSSSTSGATGGHGGPGGARRARRATGSRLQLKTGDV